MQIIKELIRSFDVIMSRDNQGNTGVHIAAYRGHLSVVEVLLQASPSVANLTNNVGDTFLHMAVSGFRTPGFRRVDRQIELMKQLVGGNIVNLQEIINLRNIDGRTALHMAVIGNIHSNLVELLMSVRSIDLNIRDVDGMTPLDLLSQRPRSASSEILIKQLISAGGISNSQDYMARSAIASQLKMQGIGSSPGTSFKISDAEIFLYTGIENVSEISADRGSGRLSSCSSTSRSELSHVEIVNGNPGSSGSKKPNSVNNAARRLKILLGWPRRKDKKMLADDNSSESYRKAGELDDTPTPLRQRFSRASALPNSKRTLAVRSSLPSPSTKKKFATGLMHGVIQAMPHLAVPSRTPTAFSRSPALSPAVLEKQKGVISANENGQPSCSKPSADEGSNDVSQKSNSINNRLMNQYFCFGAQGLSVEDSIRGAQSSRSYKRSVLSTA
ncbi:hypothetical protein ACLOJK_008285 [Asimina triloba]